MNVEAQAPGNAGTAGQNLRGQTPTGSAPGSALNAIVVCILVLAVAARLFLIITTHATEEDFYITLRYAANLAHGAGFVYNSGAPVLGTTTPLYTLILALFLRVHIDPIFGGKMLAVGADALSCWFVWRLGCRLQRPMAGLCAALCLAIAPLNLTESVKGMESSLVACAGIGAWSFWAERRERAAWTCAALLTLLRIDGAVLALILLAASLWPRQTALDSAASRGSQQAVNDRAVSPPNVRDWRQFPWRGLLVFVILTLPWFVYVTVTFGSPVPTSLRAKLIVYGWHSRMLFPNLLPFLALMTHNPLNVFLLAGALMMVLFLVMRLCLPRLQAELPRYRSIVLTSIIVWLLLYYGGMAFSKVFLFGWYFLPPTPAYYLVACIGWSCLASVAGWRGNWIDHRRQMTQLAAITLLSAVILELGIVPRVARDLKESQRAEDELRVPIALWLKAHALPHDTVMLEPIGYIGYYSGLRVLDTVGLVSPESLPAYREQNPSPYHALWRQFRPEWVLLRTGEWNDLQRYEQTIPAYDRLPTWYHLANTWQSPGTSPESAPAFYLFHHIDE